MMSKVKKSKKSQITVFIIVGIVLVIIAGLVYYFVFMQADKPFDDIANEKIDIGIIRNHIDDCMNSVSGTGLQLLGIQGGRIYLSDEFLETYYSNISYSYYDGQNKVVSLSEMQEQLDEYIENAMLMCVNDFSELEDEGIDVSLSDVNANTLIKPNDVVFKLSLGLLISGQKRSEEFEHSLNIRLYDIHGYANDIVDKIVLDPDWIDMTYLSEFDLPISIIPHSEDEFIIAITDPKSVVGNDFIYLLGFRFKKNFAPNLDIPDMLRLERGAKFTYQVKAVDPEEDDFVFTDNHAMLDISDSGLIDFVPSVSGDFDVVISVTDSHDNSNSKKVRFMVR